MTNFEGFQASPEQEERNRHFLAILKLFSDICEREGIRWYAAYGTVLGAVRHQGFIPWDDDVDVMVGVDDYPTMLRALRKGLRGTPYTVNSHYWDPGHDQLFARIEMPSDQGLHFDLWPLAGAPSGRVRQRLFTYATYLTRVAFYVKRLSIERHFADSPSRGRQMRVLKTLLMPFPARFLAEAHARLESMYPLDSCRYVRVSCDDLLPGRTMPSNWMRPPARLPFEDIQVPVPRDYHQYLTSNYGDYMTPHQGGPDHEQT